MMTEVQSTVAGTKRKVLKTTVEESFTDLFLDGYGAADKRMLKLVNQFIKYVLANLVTAGTLEAMLVLNFDK